MTAPVIFINGPTAAVSIYNSTFTGIKETPGASAEQNSVVADPLKTNTLFGDSLAAANITAGVKPIESAPKGLFLSDEDPLFLQLQKVR
jgi:hypothetical protein